MILALCFLSAPHCHKTRRHLVKGRSPETNLWLDDSMLTYTCLLAIHCTDECFNNKLTHFEVHLFIATICCHGWNILFIYTRSASRQHASGNTKKQNFMLVWQMVFIHKMMTVLSKWCDVMCECVCERDRERVFSRSLLLHHAITVSGHAVIPSAFHLDQYTFQGAALECDFVSQS